MTSEPGLRYADLLPLGPDDTPYRLITREGVSTFESGRRTFLTVSPDALRQLTTEAVHDLAQYRRPDDLARLRGIIDDPEASQRDRSTARDLLERLAAAGAPPRVAGTAIVVGRKSEGVLTGVDDAEAIERGVRDAGARLELEDGELVPLTTYEEQHTGNLPARTEIFSTPDGRRPEYRFLFLATGSGSADRSFLLGASPEILHPQRMRAFLADRVRPLCTAAGPPPYRLAVVLGGITAELALQTARYASAHYLDHLPTRGAASGHGFRDLELEREVLDLTRYARQDVRVVRLPRGPGTVPVAVVVGSGDDRAALGKITADGVYLERLETDPGRYLPDARPGP